MRAMNALTQNLIDTLVILLKEPGQDTLETLRISSPVLIEQLQLVQEQAVDRRDVGYLIQSALDDWLNQHPQPDEALQALFDALSKQQLIARTRTLV